MDYSKGKFIFRTFLLIIMTILTFLFPEYLDKIPNWLIFIFWCFLMFEVWHVIIPNVKTISPYGKHLRQHFRKVPHYIKDILITYTKKYNRRALLTFFLWWITILLIGLIYYLNFINTYHIILITTFFYFADHFCINIWCPFQQFLIKNRCCNTCRIYNWGHLMTFSLFIFIPNFFTYTLFFSSLVAFIQWEYLNYKFPERFSDISNANLQCRNCLIECRYNPKTSSN